MSVDLIETIEMEIITSETTTLEIIITTQAIISKDL